MFREMLNDSTVTSPVNGLAPPPLSREFSSRGSIVWGQRTLPARGGANGRPGAEHRFVCDRKGCERFRDIRRNRSHGTPAGADSCAWAFREDAEGGTLEACGPRPDKTPSALFRPAASHDGRLSKRGVSPKIALAVASIPRQPSQNPNPPREAANRGTPGSARIPAPPSSWPIGGTACPGGCARGNRPRGWHPDCSARSPSPPLLSLWERPGKGCLRHCEGGLFDMGFVQAHGFSPSDGSSLSSRSKSDSNSRSCTMRYFSNSLSA